jgi:hypothetical protein
MNPWATYASRNLAKGGTRYGTSKQRAHNSLTAKIPGNLSYQTVTVDGVEREVAIIDSDNLDTKSIYSMPGEDLVHGGLVEWMDNYWLITARDANRTLYTRGTMRQCNYLLRWVAEDKTIVERWCIVEDGTKYLTGEYGDNDYVVVRGDSRISLTLAKDKYSIQLGRENRFLIDDYDAKDVLAYRLTKPFKLGGTYGGNGVLCFVLTECATEDTDDLERHIANYYDHFPRPLRPGTEDDQLEDAVVSGATADADADSDTLRDGKRRWF